MKAWQHFCTITNHKILVMKNCFRVGLYRQGLLHDMSKYMPSEFLVGCRYYQGTRSPNNAEREITGCSTAWLHHKGRNKHHYEYWIDYGLEQPGLTGMKMPKKYVIEDVLGWIVVLLGAIVMRFTNFALIDPIMSIGVAGVFVSICFCFSSVAISAAT